MASVVHEPKIGAYRELWAGLSQEAKCEDGGRCVISRGMWHTSLRQDILESLQTKKEVETGLAAEF